MQQDYIMKIVEQFAQMLASIFKKRKEGKTQEARELISKASRHFLRIDLEYLYLYSPEQILDHFKDFSQELDTKLATQCADLLLELSLIEDAENKTAASLHFKTLSLYLYSASIPLDKEFQIPSYFEKVSRLKNELQDQSLLPKIQNSLDAYTQFLKAHLAS
jgi:hypothetical protein